MPRQHNIRWTQNDYERLKKAVRNAKDKTRRLAGKYDSDEIYLPPVPTFTELRDSITTRADLNRTINQLSNYSKKGGETKYLASNEKRSSAALRRNYEHTAKLFNSKVDQLNKEYAGTNVIIPEKINLDKNNPDSPINYLKKSSDLKSEIESLTGFLKRGAEEVVSVDGTQNNIKITKWQQEYMDQKIDQVNAARAERQEELGKWVNEHNVDPGKRSSESTGYNPTRGITEYSTPADVQKKLRMLRREGRSDYWTARDELAREEYVKRLLDEYGTDNPYVNEMIENIKKMDIEQWKDTFRSEPDEFDLTYSVDTDAMREHLLKLYNMWGSASAEVKDKRLAEIESMTLIKNK